MENERNFKGTNAWMTSAVIGIRTLTIGPNR